MRKIIFVLLALLLTLAGCGKEALPETSSVPSEDTHITSPAEEKTEQSTVPSSEPAKTTEAPEETAVSKAESGTSDSSVKEPKQNTSSGGPTEPTEKTAPAENTSPTEPTETTPTVPNASASDAGAIAELVAQYLNDYRTAQGTGLPSPGCPVSRDMPNTAAARLSRTSHTTPWMNGRRQRHCPTGCMWILLHTEWMESHIIPPARAKRSPRPDMRALSIM